MNKKNRIEFARIEKQISAIKPVSPQMYQIEDYERLLHLINRLWELQHLKK